MGAAVGLSIAEMQRVAGCSRQTIYNQLPQGQTRRVLPPDAQIGLETLVVLVGAGGVLPVAALAKRLRLELQAVVAPLRALVAHRLCRLEPPGVLQEATIVWVEDGADEVLREDLDDLLVARPDSIAVHLHVDEGDAEAVGRAADEIVSRHEHVLMHAGVAPSVMSGPELALAVSAPTVRRAMTIASSLWDEIRDRARLRPQPARFATVIPPAFPPPATSAVLVSFLDALVDAAPDAADEAEFARTRYPGNVGERRLAGRCLTTAARALRVSLGQPREPRAIDNSEAAFFELEAVMPLRLGGPHDRIRQPLVAALDRAVERLGPFAGGRMGSFRGVGERPNLVEEVRPTDDDLQFIARHSGRTVGYAVAVGAVDAGEELARVMSGR